MYYYYLSKYPILEDLMAIAHECKYSGGMQRKIVYEHIKNLVEWIAPQYARLILPAFETELRQGEKA